MATIHKLKKDGTTIFPATITDAVVHPSVGKTVTDMIKEYNVSELFPTEGIDGGNTYTLALAITVLGSHLRTAEKNGSLKVTFIPNGQVGTQYTSTYIKSKQAWSTTATDWNEQVVFGEEIVDPSGTWEPSTAEAYIDSKVTEQNAIIADLQVDINDSARIGSDDGTAAVANFSPVADTVWNKTQTLTQAQKIQVEKNLSLSGNTASRPTNVTVGFQYFDTDLGKPIFWSGSGWVDATGTTA